VSVVINKISSDLIQCQFWAISFWINQKACLHFVWHCTRS